jgi:hypothetical protein
LNFYFVEFSKNVNIFILSYKRILSLMISDALYELQFFQLMGVFKFMNFEKYNKILQNFLEVIFKVKKFY